MQNTSDIDDEVINEERETSVYTKEIKTRQKLFAIATKTIDITQNVDLIYF